MRLIDILVEELPNRGGWPIGATSVVQDADDTEFYFFNGGPVFNSGRSWWFKEQCDSESCWIFFDGKFEVTEDHATSIITRAQYEAALAAKNAPAWNGEGLPPVGCEFEYSHSTNNDGSTHFARATMVASGKQISIIRLPNGNEMWVDNTIGFRPLRTEADRKRDAACRVISDILDENRDFQFDAKKVYDAIAAGKIPGVKLEG